MDHDDTATASRLFTLRVWAETIGSGGAGSDRRGQVRDVMTGAHRSFREWSDLTAFLDEQLADARANKLCQTDDGRTT